MTVMLSSSPEWRCTTSSRVACRPPGDTASVSPVKSLITGTCSFTHSPVTSSFSGSRGAGLGDDASAAGPDCVSVSSSSSSTIRARSVSTRVFASPIVATPCEVNHAGVGTSSVRRGRSLRARCAASEGVLDRVSAVAAANARARCHYAPAVRLPSRRAAGTNGKCSRSALREASRKATLRRRGFRGTEFCVRHRWKVDLCPTEKNLFLSFTRSGSFPFHSVPSLGTGS